MKRPINIRFDSGTQVDRIKKAAQLRKWSFNQFVVDAAENAADKTLTHAKAEQLTDPGVPPTLNQ